MKRIDKKWIWLYVGIPSLLIAVTHDENISNNYDALQAVSGIFEPILNAQTSSITSVINIFGIMFGVFATAIAVILGYKISNIEKNISANRETMNIIQIDTMKSIDESEKWFMQKIDEINNKLEKNIETKVKDEFISSSTKMIQNVEEYAYKELSYKMENIKNSVEKRLFTYQNLIYNINMNKGLEYDEVLKEDTDANTKLKNMVNIQKRYNETNNITIPNLLSPHIKKDVVPALKKLSEIEEINAIIEDFMLKTLKLNIYSVSDSSMIKHILERYYGDNKNEA